MYSQFPEPTTSVLAKTYQSCIIKVETNGEGVMQARVQKWGNSLAVRIPKSFAALSHLGQNTLVEMSVEDGKIILFPIPHPEITLAQLLENVSTENLHRETETDGAVGQEAW
jgi:antitoxin MazE